MTAEELIAQLQALPPETRVLVEGYETGFDEIVDLKAQKVVQYRNARTGMASTKCQAGSPTLKPE